MTKKKKSPSKKDRLIEAYKSSFGNLTKAAEAARVGRASHYRWMEEDEEYRGRFLAAEESLIDQCEAVVFQEASQDAKTSLAVLERKRPEDWNLRAITEKVTKEGSTDNEIIVTVRPSPRRHDPDAIEKALLEEFH